MQFICWIAFLESHYSPKNFKTNVSRAPVSPLYWTPWDVWKASSSSSVGTAVRPNKHGTTACEYVHVWDTLRGLLCLGILSLFLYPFFCVYCALFCPERAVSFALFEGQELSMLPWIFSQPWHPWENNHWGRVRIQCKYGDVVDDSTRTKWLICMMV